MIFFPKIESLVRLGTSTGEYYLLVLFKNQILLQKPDGSLVSCFNQSWPLQPSKGKTCFYLHLKGSREAIDVGSIKCIDPITTENIGQFPDCAIRFRETYLRTDVIFFANYAKYARNALLRFVTHQRQFRSQQWTMLSEWLDQNGLKKHVLHILKEAWREYEREFADDDALVLAIRELSKTLAFLGKDHRSVADRSEYEPYLDVLEAITSQCWIWQAGDEPKGAEPILSDKERFNQKLREIAREY